MPDANPDNAGSNLVTVEPNDKPAAAEHDPLAYAKLQHALTRQELATARLAQEQRKLIRRSRIATLNE